jgi:hypothetical protein
MAKEKTFKDMANDRVWINQFYNTLVAYPIKFQSNKPDESMDIFELLASKRNLSYDLAIIINKIDEEIILSGQHINLINEDVMLGNFFISFRNCNNYLKDEFHLTLVLLFNFLYKLYTTKGKTIFQKLVSKIKDDLDIVNDFPLFTIKELQTFFDTKLKTDFENFISQGTSLDDVLENYEQNNILLELVKQNLMGNDEIELLRCFDAFIQYLSDNDIPIDIPKVKELRKSKHITPDVLYKLIQMRDKLVIDREQKNVSIQVMKQTADFFSNTTNNRFVYTTLRDWLQDNVIVLHELKGSKAKGIIQVLDKNLIKRWFKTLAKVDPFFYNKYL